MAALPPDVVAHYDDLCRHLPGGFDQAACVSVLPGARDLADILDDLGVVTRREDAMDAEAFAEASFSRWDDGPPEEEVAWVVQDGPFTVLLEANGFAGSMPEVLRPVSRDGHLAASMMWIDANGASALSYARDAEVESCQADYGSEDILRHCPTLAAYLSELWALTDDGWPGYRAGGLATLEMLTGFRLTREHFARRWPAVWFRVRQVAPKLPPGALTTVDAELALAVIHASLAAYSRASREVATAVARVADVADLPAVATFLAALADDDPGRTPKSALNRLSSGWQDDYFAVGVENAPDQARVRYLAGRILAGIAGELTDDFLISLDVRSSWQEAPWALGHAWGPVRDRALRLLTG